jgi:membrane protein DedA with SNARE-associated domain
MGPRIREIISIPAGISKMNIQNFILFMFAGSLIWCVYLTLVGYVGVLGTNLLKDQALLYYIYSNNCGNFVSSRTSLLP